MLELMKQFALMGSEWVLWLLVVLSIVSIAIMIERTIVILLARGDSETLIEQIAQLVEAGEFDRAAKLLESNRSAVATVLRDGLMNASAGTKVAREVMEAQTEKQQVRLMRHLAFLGTVGANAPFIGLFGTVLGIIRAFHDLAHSTQQGPSVVMAGISEALVATAIGLLVAIPAVVAYNYFRTVVGRIISDCRRGARLLGALMDASQSKVSSTNELENRQDDNLSGSARSV